MKSRSKAIFFFDEIRSTTLSRMAPLRAPLLQSIFILPRTPIPNLALEMNQAEINVRQHYWDRHVPGVPRHSRVGMKGTYRGRRVDRPARWTLGEVQRI